MAQLLAYENIYSSDSNILALTASTPEGDLGCQQYYGALRDSLALDKKSSSFINQRLVLVTRLLQNLLSFEATSLMPPPRTAGIRNLSLTSLNRQFLLLTQKYLLSEKATYWQRNQQASHLQTLQWTQTARQRKRYLWRIVCPLPVHKELVLVLSLWQVEDCDKVIVTGIQDKQSALKYSEKYIDL